MVRLGSGATTLVVAVDVHLGSIILVQLYGRLAKPTTTTHPSGVSLLLFICFHLLLFVVSCFACVSFCFPMFFSVLFFRFLVFSLVFSAVGFFFDSFLNLAFLLRLVEK